VEVMDVQVLVERVRPAKLALMEFVSLFVHPTVQEEIAAVTDVEVLVVPAQQENLVRLLESVPWFVEMESVILAKKTLSTVLRIVKFVEMVSVVGTKLEQVVP